MRTLATSLLLVLSMSGAALAGDHEKIESAMSAGPASISANAAVLDWDGTVLREGTNGWTCRPDNAGTAGIDPWCYNDAWGNFLAAYSTKTEPSYTTVGVAYMLAGDASVSNTDPYATEFTNDEDWVTGLGAHMMLLLPGEDALAGYSADPHNGGPWIMWPDTPYAHLMIPIDSYGD